MKYTLWIGIAKIFTLEGTLLILLYFMELLHCNLYGVFCSIWIPEAFNVLVGFWVGWFLLVFFFFFSNKYMNISIKSISGNTYLRQPWRFSIVRGNNWMMSSLNPSNDFQGTEAIETEPQL